MDIEERNPVSNAVRGLRLYLSETQQQFANRMKTAITTIARYETSRPPRGKVLAQLEGLARESGDDEDANVFREALELELGQTVPVIQLPPGYELADGKIMIQMLPRLDSPLPEAGTEIALSDPRRILAQYSRNLDSLISGDDPAVSGEPAERIRGVTEGLKKVISFFGQKVRAVPAKLEFVNFDLMKVHRRASSATSDQPKQGDDPQDVK